MGARKLKDALRGKKQPEVKIINTITTTPVQRGVQDIGKWRTAMRAAEATIPRRTLLYDLYDDILLDGHLFATWDRRERAVSVIEWQFTDTEKKPVEAVNQLIDTLGFDALLKSIMSATAWGYAAGECILTNNGLQYDEFPKKHIRPKTGIIANTQYSDDGTNIREGFYANTCVEFGDANDLGILLKAAQYVIYKRGGFGDWAQFAELFGMPFRVGTYDGYDDTQRIKLEEALAKQGGAGYVVKPKGSDIAFIQNQTNADGKLYDILVAACNKELSKIILGQTMTTEDGASRSQAQVHQGVEEAIFVADVVRVRRTLNSKFIPILQAAGIDTKGGSFSVKNFGREKLSLKDFAEIVLKLKGNGLPVDDDYLYETFGIPKPLNYDAQKTAVTEAKNAPTPTNTPPENTPNTPPTSNDPKPKANTKNAQQNLLRRFGRYVKSFFEQAPSSAGLIAQLTDLYGSNHTCSHCGGYIKLSDGFNHDIEKTLNNLLKDIYDGSIAEGQIPIDYYEQTAKSFQKAVAEGLGGQVFPADDYRNTLKAYLDQNVYAFSAAKSFAMLEQMRNALTDNNGDVVSFATFKEKVSSITKLFNKTWLETEYNSAIACAQMAEKWESLKGFDLLEYRTVGDDRVSPEHAALDKIIVSTKSRLIDKIYPVKRFRCRCTMIPASANAIATDIDTVKKLASQMNVKPYFKKHVGKERIVFDTESHPYTQSLGGIKLSQLRAITNYNMSSVAKIYENSHRLPKSTDLSQQEANILWEKIATNDSVKITAADGIEWSFDYKNFKKHLFKENNRWHILNRLEPTLVNPDEVWVRREEGILYHTYIKYYQDYPVRLSYDTDSKKWTMIPMDSQSAIGNMDSRVRAGQLIYRKK